MKRIIMTIGLLLISGCSLQNNVPPVTTYRMDIKPDIDRYTSTGCQEKIIRVTHFEGTSLLRHQSIYYADESSKQYSYTKARWIESPDRQLLHQFQRSISESGLFKGVIPYKSLARNDWLLESNVHEFIQVIKNDGTSEVSLRMDLAFIDQFTRRVMATKKIALLQTGTAPDVNGAVHAFEVLSAKALKQTNIWLNEECR